MRRPAVPGEGDALLQRRDGPEDAAGGLSRNYAMRYHDSATEPRRRHRLRSLPGPCSACIRSDIHATAHTGERLCREERPAAVPAASGAAGDGCRAERQPAGCVSAHGLPGDRLSSKTRSLRGRGLVL